MNQPNKAQLPGLKSVKFGRLDEGDQLFQTVQGANSGDALDLAADLALGVERLCDRLDFATNNNEDPVTCVELRASSLLAGTAAALIQSVRYGLRNAEETGQ